MAFIDLFQPKWNRSDPRVRLAAIEKMTDRRTLAWIAQFSRHHDARDAALEKFTDQTILTEIAESRFGDIAPRLAAADRLTNRALAQSIVKDIAHTIKEDQVENLTHQPLLFEIAMTCIYSSARKAAVKTLTDQAFLAKIATTYAYEDLRILAIGRLTDQKLLAEIAKTVKSSAICEAAIESLEDQGLLAAIVKTGPGIMHSALAQLKAIRRLTDEAKLAEVAGEVADTDLRLLAFTQLTQTKRGMKILEDPAFAELREMASVDRKIDELSVMNSHRLPKPDVGKLRSLGRSLAPTHPGYVLVLDALRHLADEERRQDEADEHDCFAIGSLISHPATEALKELEARLPTTRSNEHKQ